MKNHTFETTELTIRELRHRCSCITPIINVGNNKFFCRDLSVMELLCLSLNNPVPNIVGKPLDMNSLKLIKEIITIHHYAHNGICLPTVSEVLAQIPSDLFSIACAFEITGWLPQADDYYENVVDLTANLYIAEVSIYQAK